MAIILKQSTASQEIPLGYFVDSADGDTAETALTIANTDIKIWKTGATTLADKTAGGATHIANGIYYCVLDATDTDTLGPLVVFVKVAGALAIRVECLVLAANVYDSLVAASDKLQVHADEITAGLITAAAIATGAIDADAIADGAIDAATFAAGAITASAIAADAIGASELAADAIAEIADAVWDEDATAHQTQGTFGQAIGDPGADTDTIFGLVNTNLDAAVSTRASQTSVDTVDDFLDTEIAAIKAKTDNLPASPAATGDIPTAAVIADAVWDEDATAHQTQGTFGQAIGDPGVDTDTIFGLVNTNLDAAMSTRASQASVTTIDDFLDTEIAAILADTNELQTDWANGGRLDLLIDAIKLVTDILNAAHAEPTGVPAANETPIDKLAYIFAALRNKMTVTSSAKTFFDDGGVSMWSKGLTDDGSTYTEAEGA